MVAIIDYDAGNIKSVEKAVKFLKKDCIVTRDSKEILKAEHVILPGVGAFSDAMDHLKKYDLIPVVKEVAAKETPFLGICLGLQLFFEDSEESPGVKGLALLKGHVKRIPAEEGLKIPHIGWNSLTLQNDGRLFSGMEGEPYVYFVHSYYLEAEEPSVVKATTEYGTTIHASVEQGNLFACQFHPEKSGRTGLSILNRFLEL